MDLTLDMSITQGQYSCSNIILTLFNRGEEKVPIVRKVIDVGNSKAVCLPKGWLEYLEKQHGRAIKEVAIEVDRVLKIAPILPRKKEQAEP